MTTLPTDIVFAEILPKLPEKYTNRFKCVSKSYKILISTCWFLDILFNNMLPRLPAKSLLRFKCVSKSFKAKISSTEFINLHLRHSVSSCANRLVIFNRFNSRNTQTALHGFNLDFMESPAFRLILPEPFNEKGIIRIFGCCNGLVCIGVSMIWKNAFELFMLINPSTGTSLEIPPPLDQQAKVHMFCYPFRNMIGFGYDCVSHDYKVLEIVRCDIVGSLRETLVYSLKANSWKVVESTCGSRSILRNDAGALINNHLLHWLFPSFSDRIAYFDLRTDQWLRDVPFPDQDEGLRFHFTLMQLGKYGTSGYLGLHLGVLDGCLCLLTKDLVRNIAVNVWVMKKYGVKESWVKLLGVSDLPCTMSLHTYPVCYRNVSKDEILITSGDEDDIFYKLIWYKITKKQARSAEIHIVHQVFHGI